MLFDQPGQNLECVQHSGPALGWDLALNDRNLLNPKLAEAEQATVGDDATVTTIPVASLTRLSAIVSLQNLRVIG